MHRLRIARWLLCAGLVTLLCWPLVSAAGTLEAKQSKLEKEIERLEDLHEIENLMSEYYWMHAGDEMKDYLMAYHTPNARVTNDLHEHSMAQTEKNTSPKQGKDRDARRIEMRNSPGYLHVHLETSPVIELAADGKTAKGSWISPGLEADPPMDLKAGEKRTTTGYWAWAKFGADFVKENGQWRIWHLHVYSLFMTPFDESWAEVDPESEGGGAAGPPGGAAPGGANAAGGPGGSGAPGAVAPNGGMTGDTGGPPAGGGPGQEESVADPSTLPISERWLYSPTAIYPDAKPMPPAPYKTYVFEKAIAY